MSIERGNRDTLTYPGNRVLFDGNHLVGPDFGDGWLKPVEAEYDPAADTTTIRFESLRKQLWPPEATLIAMQTIQKRQVLQLAAAKAGNRKAINDIVWGGNDGPAKAKTVDTQGASDQPVDDATQRVGKAGNNRRASHRSTRARRH